MRALLRRRTQPTMRPVTTTRPPRAPGAQVLVQARVDHFTRWTASLVTQAIEAHETGDFSQSALLVEAMGRDDRISGVATTRINAVVGANGPDFSLEPAEGQSEELARRVERWWFEVLPDHVLKQIVRDMIFVGVSVWRVHWQLSEREWRPVRLERWHTANLSWDEDDQCYWARTDRSEIEVRRGDPNWLIIEPLGDRSWMGGAVRALGLAYLMRTFNWRDWARFNERHGLPILTITEPAGGDKRQKLEFYQAIQKMGSGGIVRLPMNNQGQGYRLELVEAKDDSHASFTAFRQDLDISIAVLMLGQNLSTEVKGGSFAAATAHERIRQDFLEGDTEVLSTSLREGLLVPWVAFNTAAADAAELAPWPTWATAVPLDRKSEADTAKTGAEAVAAWRKTKMPVDYRRLLERLDVPVLEGQDPNAAAPMDPEPTSGNEGQAGDRRGATVTPRSAFAHSGIRMESTSGFITGQTYTDDLVDAARDEAGRAQKRGLVQDLLALIAEGGDYQAIRDRVLRHYQDRAQPAEVRDLIHQAMVLAQLAGRAAVLEDA